ncbi:MAG: MFS transporter [Microbacterium sp.]|uniref:MFS transporter n=1 Tax=Microbacterium sp. TaxID=51671 RepID=UPI0039E2B50A
MASNACLRASSFMLMTLVPVYVMDNGFSAADAGLTTTLYMGAAVLMRPVAGSLVDRRGRWIAMTIGAVAFTVASGLLPLATPLWLFLVVRAIQGLGFSLNGTAVMTLATDIIPERRLAQGIGLLGLEQTIVQMFAPWLALELRAVAGYAVAFLVVFAFGVLNLLLRIPLAATSRRVDRERRERILVREDDPLRQTRVPLWHRVVERDAWRVSSVMFFVMFGTTSVNSFLAAYAIARGIENAGFFFTASGLAVAVSRVLLVPLGRRFGQLKVVMPGIVTVSLAMLVIVWAPGLPQLIVAGLLYGLGTGMIAPGLNTLAILGASRRNRGRASSTFYMAMDLGNALGAAALGVVASASGLGSAFVVSSVVVVVAGLVLALQWWRGWVSDPR